MCSAARGIVLWALHIACVGPRSFLFRHLGKQVKSSIMKAFSVFPKDRPEWDRTVNAATAGKAKVHLLKSLHDAGWTYKFTDLVAHSLGGPHTSDDFKRCAEYRGVPFAKCGMRVIFSDRDEGIIQGHGSGACFNILFTTGKNKGLVLNCHPNWHITYLNDDGTVIRKFGP